MQGNEEDTQEACQTEVNFQELLRENVTNAGFTTQRAENRDPLNLTNTPSPDDGSRITDNTPGTNIDETGGDSRYNRSRGDVLFKEANPDLELEAKNKRVTDKLSENMNIVANEPSLAFFRIQEHVRKCLPQLVETKHEVQAIQQSVQGASFDAEYAANAVKEMHKSAHHFQGIQDLLKNSMFMKQQIDYEEARREQEKLHPSMYTTVSSPDINLAAEGGAVRGGAGQEPVHSVPKHAHRARSHSSRSRHRVKRVRRNPHVKPSPAHQDIQKIEPVLSIQN